MKYILTETNDHNNDDVIKISGDITISIDVKDVSPINYEFILKKAKEILDFLNK
jgi:hypothetical protein